MTLRPDAPASTPLRHPVRTTTPERAEPWRDNAYLAFWDQDAGVFGSAHVSTSPNAEGRRARFSLSVGGKVLEIIEELAPGTFTSASVDFDLAGRVAVGSPTLSGELHLSAIFALADYSRHGIFPGLVDTEPLIHYQQAVRVTGRLVVDGAAIDVDGAGFQDRTWGYRDEHTTISEHIAVMAVFDSNALSLMRFRTPSGSDRVEGYVLGTAADPVTGISVTRDASGLLASASLTCPTGAPIELEATERATGFWVPVGTRRQGPALSVYDEFVVVRTGSGDAGFAMIEHGVLRMLY